MLDEQNLVDLISRSKAGEEEANRTLKQLENDLRIMVRARLPQAIRAEFDSMDFVQSVWQSFLRLAKDDPERLARTGNLLAFLAGMARNKVYEEHRRKTQAQKFAIGRQAPLVTVRRDRKDGVEEVVDPEPSPVERAEASDRLDQLTAGRSPEEAEAIRLRSQGQTYEEIARRTGMNERTVRRLFDSIRTWMEERGWR